jgi:hypothetical protein
MWRHLSRGLGWVVGPQRDHEAVTLVDARLRSRLKSSQGAFGFGEPLGKLGFELCDVLPLRCDSGKDVARQHAHHKLVRVLTNDRVADRQVKR